MSSLRKTVVLFSLLAALAPAMLEAKHALPGPHFVACDVLADAVELSWDGLFIDPERHAARLFRDDALISEPAPDSLRFFDTGVPEGRHVYRLDIVDVASDPETLIDSKGCEADVPAVPGIRCEVFGGIAVPPEVHVAWEPLPPAAAIRILRDGETVAELPGDALAYSEEPLTGDHIYTVIAVTAAVGPDVPGEDVPVGSCLASYETPSLGGFVRGDCNADGNTDVSDAVCTLLYLFLGGREPPCVKSADADDSGKVDVTDAIHLLHGLFLGGPAPSTPFPGCGEDPTPDELSCEAFPRCFHPPPP